MPLLVLSNLLSISTVNNVLPFRANTNILVFRSSNSYKRWCMNRILKKLPEKAKSPLRRLRNEFKYHGSERYCPVCKKSSNRFEAFGVPPAPQRIDALCPRCGALERHRLLWLFLEQKTNLLKGVDVGAMLHVAPEPLLEKRFASIVGDGYLTADLYNPRAMVEMDITNIKFPEKTFDVIYCSHVLEHVQDDRTAIGEFHRVLKDDGWAILLVPIVASETYEDPSITEPEDRQRHFGQSDHVRVYGPDYIDRLRAAGFTVEKTTVDDLVDSERANLMGLTNASGEIFFCTK